MTIAVQLRCAESQKVPGETGPGPSKTTVTLKVTSAGSEGVAINRERFMLERNKTGPHTGLTLGEPDWPLATITITGMTGAQEPQEERP